MFSIWYDQSDDMVQHHGYTKRETIKYKKFSLDRPYKYLWNLLYPTLSKMHFNFSRTVSRCEAAICERQKSCKVQKRNLHQENYTILPYQHTSPMPLARPSLFVGTEMFACAYIHSIFPLTYTLSSTFWRSIPRHLQNKVWKKTQKYRSNIYS